MSWVLLLALATAGDVKAVTLSGEVVEGALVTISETGVVVETAAGSQSISLLDLRTIETLKAVTKTDPESKILLTLRDGSSIPVRQYTQLEGIATITHGMFGTLQIPARGIAHVLLKSQPEGSELAKQWKALTKVTPKEDLVVFRVEESLDYLEGIIYGVGEEKLDFGFAGERNSPRRTRVEGVVFFHGTESSSPQLLQMIDRSGGIWNISSIETKVDAKGQKTLAVKTVAGAAVELSPNLIARYDFSSTNTTYLSDLEMEKSDWRPFLNFGSLSAIQKLRFGPRRDKNLNGEPLRIGDQVYRKGLAMHSRTEISYRLREDYDSFRAVVGVDRARVGDIGGNAELVVTADGGRELFRSKLSVEAPPLPIEINLKKVRRLTIIVDFGDENDIGDHVILGEARLTK
jgi:hypothetical protein